MAPLTIARFLIRNRRVHLDRVLALGRIPPVEAPRVSAIEERDVSLQGPTVRPPRESLFCFVVVFDDAIDFSGVGGTLLVLGNRGNHVFQQSCSLGIEVLRDPRSNGSTSDQFLADAIHVASMIDPIVADRFARARGLSRIRPGDWKGVRLEPNERAWRSVVR